MALKSAFIIENYTNYYPIFKGAHVPRRPGQMSRLGCRDFAMLYNLIARKDLREMNGRLLMSFLNFRKLILAIITLFTIFVPSQTAIGRQETVFISQSPGDGGLPGLYFGQF